MTNGIVMKRIERMPLYHVLVGTHIWAAFGVHSTYLLHVYVLVNAADGLVENAIGIKKLEYSSIDLERNL